MLMWRDNLPIWHALKAMHSDILALKDTLDEIKQAVTWDEEVDDDMTNYTIRTRESEGEAMSIDSAEEGVESEASMRSAPW